MRAPGGRAAGAGLGEEGGNAGGDVGPSIRVQAGGVAPLCRPQLRELARVCVCVRLGVARVVVGHVLLLHRFICRVECTARRLRAGLQQVNKARRMADVIRRAGATDSRKGCFTVDADAKMQISLWANVNKFALTLSKYLQRLGKRKLTWGVGKPS